MAYTITKCPTSSDQLWDSKVGRRKIYFEKFKVRLQRCKIREIHVAVAMLQQSLLALAPLSQLPKPFWVSVGGRFEDEYKS